MDEIRSLPVCNLIFQFLPQVIAYYCENNCNVTTKMVDSVTNNDLKQPFNSTWFLVEFECSFCFHGGKCKRTGFTTKIQCLCTDGYTGARCQRSVVDDFSVGENPQSNNSGLATGITIGACFLILVAAIAFFLWRKHRNNTKKEEKEIQTNRMKKMSIEGMSIVGEKPSAAKRTPIPVCIAIQEENMGQDHIKLSLDEHNNSYTNPMNPWKVEQKALESKNSIEIVWTHTLTGDHTQGT